MKKISKIRLNRLSDSELEAKEQSHLYGGSATECTCACDYEGSGGSSKAVNGRANWTKGLDSVGGSGDSYGSCSCVGVTENGGTGSTGSEAQTNKWGSI